MRLIGSKLDGGFKLSTFNNDDIPPYAILSHTWSEGNEVTYDELVTDTGMNKAGYTKPSVIISAVGYGRTYQSPFVLSLR